MDRDKSPEHRHCRRVARKRIGLASLLNSNLLKLGAGVSVSVASCGLAIADGPAPMRLPQQINTSAVTVRSNPFVTPTTSSPNLFATVSGPTGTVMQTSDVQLSGLRLKSIGTAVGLVPIGQPRSVDPTIEITQPHPSKIQVNPMAGGSPERLDPPVMNFDELVFETETAAPQLEPKPPRILSLLRTDTAVTHSPPVTTDAVSELPTMAVESVMPPTTAAVQPIAAPEMPIEIVSDPQDNLLDDAEHGVSFSFSDWSDNVDDRDIHAAASDAETSEANAPDDALTNTTAFVIPPPPVNETPRKLTSLAVEEVKEVESNDVAAIERDEDDFKQLPILPIPQRQWVDRQPTALSSAKYPQRHRQHVEVAAPPMIAAARVERPGAVSGTPIIPAKLAGFLLPKSQTPEPAVSQPVEIDPVTQLTQEIRENHPTARVSFAEENKKMVVRGVCRSRDQATDVIRLIRSRFLTPVDDQLVVR